MLLVSHDIFLEDNVILKYEDYMTLLNKIKDLEKEKQMLEGGAQRAIELRALLDELFPAPKNKFYTDDEIRLMMRELRANAKDAIEQKECLKNEVADLQMRMKGDSLKNDIIKKLFNTPDPCTNASETALKGAEAKIQSANDRLAKAKEKAREANERAERYREENIILRTRLQQVEEFNSNLLKEFARKEMTDGNSNPD